MRYDRPIQFNRNPITSSRPLRKLGRNLFWSLGVPVVLTLIALILSSIAQQNMFIVEVFIAAVLLIVLINSEKHMLF